MMETATKESAGTRANRAAALLKQASDPTRLQILMLLAERDRNVTELCAALGHLSQPAVSHHLQLCRMGSVVESRRRGKTNVYAITDRGLGLVRAVESLTN
jgi:DNA-binding transcriptional ArsR family regulator